MPKTIVKRSRKSEITAASIENTQHQVERAIAEAFDPDSVMRAYDMATALRLLSHQANANKAVQNRCGATHTKSVRKIGEVTVAMRESGALVTHGGKRTKIDQEELDDSSSKPSTLKDLGISKDIAAAGVKLLAIDASEIDAMAEAATKDGKDFSCKRAVAEVREKHAEKKKSLEKAEAIKRRKSVDGLYLGDFRKIGDKIPDASVDLIFTDPPYDRKAIELFDGLGEFAARVLRPGGSLIAYIGQIQLPDAVADLSKHLRYWWTCSCYHSGPTLLRMNEYGIVNGWKPMLWFVKETRGDKTTFVNDVATGSREKSHHEWQQSEAEARYFIELLTEKDGFVVDPFCGGGTTPAACIGLGRKWAAFEIDEANLARASERIVEAQK
jgi:16S rRNA G966 N2-methylase RsmD